MLISTACSLFKASVYLAQPNLFCATWRGLQSRSSILDLHFSLFFFRNAAGTARQVRGEIGINYSALEEEEKRQEDILNELQGLQQGFPAQTPQRDNLSRLQFLQDDAKDNVEALRYLKVIASFENDYSVS
ncbi:hypothetical protein Ciccas_004267 [Cichlidogyrus casuarinus]|uniref:Uncharacterized protein n=1 Tax=Cichlidogyrus casuarinus TaxID=1844966 RepID=A0ABD2QC11_9PLAT